MACACSRSVLSLGLLGCGPLLFRAHAKDCRRDPTLALHAGTLPRPQQEIKGLQYCHTAATATATVIAVTCWSLLQHLAAFPQTPKRCYRSTLNASQLRLTMRLVLVTFFLPGSRASFVTTNGNTSDAYVGERLLADTNNHGADGSQLAEISDICVWQSLARTNLPWILGGLLLVTIAGMLYHMMPGLGGGSRTDNFNYRIPPAWSPE